MDFLFLITTAVFLLLYFREHRKYKTMEKEYRYINSRFLVLAQSEENSYILLPTDNAVVKETAENTNLLLEKFYAAQIDYNRSQKLFLQLFTNISHDLRTPITVLKGYIEMLYLQSKKEALSPVMQATLDKMQRNSKELADSVNNLFDMAKIRSGDIIL